MTKRIRVIVVGNGVITPAHPACARIRRKQGAWRRSRGKTFRMSTEVHGNECVTPLVGRSLATRRCVPKLVLYASGPLVPQVHRHSDSRVPRGAILQFNAEAFGLQVAHKLGNHGTMHKAPWVFSVSRNNPRRMYITLASTDNAESLQLMHELAILLRGGSLTIGNGGPGTHVVRVLEAKVVMWQTRGVYLDVAAASEAEAVKLVPGGFSALQRPGRAGKRSEYSAWRVTTRREVRCPVQVGPMGSYGYGVLA